MEREMGEQPIARILKEEGLDAGDLVEASTDNITYKMVSKACKGRRLTPQIQRKIRDAMNKASAKCFDLEDLFLY